MKNGIDELIAVVARLRSPKGCPWDRRQNHLSLIKYLKEETAELVEALEGGNPDEIEDELGDLFLQIALHSRIAQESGRFDIHDVARSQALKLRRRHPHVFGGARYKTAEAVMRNWKTIKGKERRLRALDLIRRGKKK